MAQEEKTLPKGNMMQLEEINRATSPEEYRQKYDQWMRDRGFPVEDQIFSFVQVMQYCERLESVHGKLAAVQVELAQLRAESEQRVRELEQIRQRAEEVLAPSLLATVWRWVRG